jgi:hypothetical protein
LSSALKQVTESQAAPSSYNQKDSHRLESFLSAFSLVSTHGARIWDESLQVIKFGKNRIYSTGSGFLLYLEIALRCQHEDGQSRHDFPKFLRQLKSVHFWQGEVQDCQVSQ